MCVVILLQGVNLFLYLDILMREMNPGAVCSLSTRHETWKKNESLKLRYTSVCLFFLKDVCSLLWCVNWTWQSRARCNNFKVLIWYSFRCEPCSSRWWRKQIIGPLIIINAWSPSTTTHPPSFPVHHLVCCLCVYVYMVWCVVFLGVLCEPCFFPLGVSLADPLTPLSLRTAS